MPIDSASGAANPLIMTPYMADAPTKQRESRLLGAVSLAAVTIAAWILLTTAGCVMVASCNLPYADEWDLWTSLARRGYSLGWFFALHNDHRIATTRLIFAVDQLAFQAHIWFPQTVSLAAQAMLAAILLRFARRMSPAAPVDGILAGAIVGCLFSAQQSINFIWGFQVQFFLVYMFAAAALFALLRGCSAASETSRSGWMAASLALAAASTWSMANGVLIWPILVLAAVGLGARPIWIALTAAAGAGILALYFSGWHSSPLDAPAPATRIVSFALAHAGAPIVPLLRALGCGDAIRDITATLAGAAVLGSACWMWLQTWRSRGLDDKTRAPLLLANFALFAGAASFAIAAGRAHLPLVEAFRSRYVTPSYILWVAVLILAWPRLHSRARIAVMLALAFGIAPYQWAKLRDAGGYGAALRQASVALAAGVNDPDVRPYLLRPVTDSTEAAAWLRANRLAVFSEDWTGWVGRTAVAPTSCRGSVSDAVPVNDLGRPGWRVTGSIEDGLNIVVLARRGAGTIESSSPVISGRWTLYAHPGNGGVAIYGVRPDGKTLCTAAFHELH